MSLKKKPLKTKPICKVTFTLPAEAAKDATQVALVGEFNEWRADATPMKRSKNGDYSVTVDLEAGREYQFRYLVDGEAWENDAEADRYEFSHFASCDNSVVCC